MNKILGIASVFATWFLAVYLIVALVVFWNATQRDWQQISPRVVARNIVASLLWIKEIL